MPGELGNCIAGRVANLFNLRGPNYVVDAACASAMAAMDAGDRGAGRGRLRRRRSRAASTATWAPSTFIKFCKIGALSATGTRPYADGADGFVMGEGAAVFVLKRLADAERDGDRIYAVVRGIAGSSDGKGKGITAPNPIGQRLAVERAWAQRRRSTPRPARWSRATAPPRASATWSRSRASARRSSDAGLAPGLGRARLGQVEHRPPQGRRGRRRDPQDGAGAAPQGAAAEPQLRAPEPEHRLGRDARSRVNTELREWELPQRRRARGRRERLRLRRHQLPRRARGVRARARLERRTAELAAHRGAGRRRRRERDAPRRRPARSAAARRARAGGADASARRRGCGRRSSGAQARRRARAGAAPSRADLARARAHRDRLRRRRRAGRRKAARR